MVKKTNILTYASYIDEDVKNINYDYWRIENNELLPNIDNMNIKENSSKNFLQKFGNYNSCIDTQIPIISEKGIKQIIKLVKSYNNLYHYFIINDEDNGYADIYTIRIKSLFDKVIIMIDIMDCCNQLDSLQITFEYSK